MSEIFTDPVPVPAGELVAFGLAMERARQALADAQALEAAIREQAACEIEAEAATHLHSIRRGMRWAAWVARGKPAGSDPGNDHRLSGALLHGDAERTAVPCCPAEAAAVTRAVAAERERIRAGADALKVTLWRPGNGPAHTQALDVVPLEALARLLATGGDGNE